MFRVAHLVTKWKNAQDALGRARVGDDEIARTAASRMSLTVADSTEEVLAKVGALSPETSAGGGGGGGGKEGAAVAAARPDVVYLDPMFPQQKKGRNKKKSALVKKGMQMLQALLEEAVEGEEEREEEEEEERERGRPRLGLASMPRHEDGGGGGGEDSREGVGVGADEERRLFDVAMSVATRKVVVKRPVRGETIVRHVKPSHAVVSKNGRFDVYVVPPPAVG